MHNQPCDWIGALAIRFACPYETTWTAVDTRADPLRLERPMYRAWELTTKTPRRRKRITQQEVWNTHLSRIR